MTIRRQVVPDIGPFVEALALDANFLTVPGLSGDPAVALSRLEVINTDVATDIEFRYGTDDATFVPTNGLGNGAYVEDVPGDGLVVDAGKGPVQVRAPGGAGSATVRWWTIHTPAAP